MGIETALAGAAIGGSIWGSEKQSDAAEEAAKTQQYGANAAANAATQGNALAQAQYKPFTDAGLMSLPFLQQATTGIAPQALTDREREELSQLEQQMSGPISGWYDKPITRLDPNSTFDQALTYLNEMMGQAGTSHSTRHYGEAFGGAQAEFQRMQDRYDELTRQQQVFDSYDSGEMAKYQPDYEKQQGYVNALENLGGYDELQGIVDQIANLPNMTGEQFQNSPMFQAKRDELERSLNRKYASRGQLYSSAADDTTMRGLGDLVEQEYGRLAGHLQNQYNLGSNLLGQRRGNLMDLYNLQSNQNATKMGNLTNLTNLGAGFAGQSGNAFMNTGQIVGQNALAGVNAQAEGIMNQGNISANLWGNIGSLPMQAYNMNALTKGLQGLNSGVPTSSGSNLPQLYASGPAVRPKYSLVPELYEP